MDGKKKPKLRMDGRRSLTFQSLNTELSRNQLWSGPDFVRKRAILRFRTLRMFFCSRYFVTAFFTPSKQDRWLQERAFPFFYPKVPCLGSASFFLHLDEEHLRPESMGLLLRLGQRDIECLCLHIDHCSRTFESLRRLTFLLSVVKSLSHLKAVKVVISWQHKAPWFVHLLRDFLPTSIRELFTSCHHDFLIPGLTASSNLAEKAEIVPNRGKAQYLAPLFRSRSRVIAVHHRLTDIAANGPFERNERVERVVVPFKPVSDLLAYEQHERMFSTALQNLRPLNDSFVLHLRFGETVYKDFQLSPALSFL
ncbi:hypothetical protein M3Y99_01597700 [Aphelenchoides fujianensis]|nr:hypothetical protein M3Y99_01597700 [Aphelenchoides fujianensis]